MKLVIVAALVLVAAAAAAPVEEVVKTLVYNFDQKPEGNYNLVFETEDGIKRSENAELKEALDEDNKPVKVLTIRGTYSYIDQEGKTETINYFADETGFHAEGPSIPLAPSRR